MPYKIFLGYLAIAFAFASYVPYFWHIYQGKTKPHAFSWFVWGTITAIGFIAQTVSGGGAGTWAIGITALLCYTVAAIAFWQGYVKFILFDWLSLSGAFLAIILWWLTKNPLAAIILVCLSDAIGYLPSIRKGYFHPNEETASAFAIDVFKYIISIFALQSLVLATWLYPATVAVLDTVFVAILLIRRKQLKRKHF